MRRKIVAANWKMHGSGIFVREYFEQLEQAWRQAPATCDDVVICPPAVLIPSVVAVAGSAGVRVGAQNLAAQAQGAFTGEVSAGMLADAGCQYVIVGHSERRQLFGETDGVIREKLAQALAAGLTSILCVGELLSERESGAASRVVSAQLREALLSFPVNAGERLVIAYEPVWAIGTGRSASAQDAQDMHRVVRETLRDMGYPAGQISVLYGGSVKAASAEGLFAQPDVDGGLVGGASLDAVEFAAICRSI